MFICSAVVVSSAAVAVCFATVACIVRRITSRIFALLRCCCCCVLTTTAVVLRHRTTHCCACSATMWYSRYCIIHSRPIKLLYHIESNRIISYHVVIIVIHRGCWPPPSSPPLAAPSPQPLSPLLSPLRYVTVAVAVAVAVASCCCCYSLCYRIAITVIIRFNCLVCKKDVSCAPARHFRRAVMLFFCSRELFFVRAPKYFVSQ